MLAFLLGLPAAAYKYGEHKIIGDRGFGRLITAIRYAPGGGSFLQLLDLKTDSGAWYFGALSQHAPVSYGVLNALSGDHSSNPYLMEEQLRMEGSALQRIMALHESYIRMGYTAAPDGKLVKTDFNYLVLAAVNIPHFYEYNKTFQQQLRNFDPALIRLCQNPAAINTAMKKLDKTNAINMYVTMHLVAVDLAEQSGLAYRSDPAAARRLLLYAFLFNAFADHFLEDAFSAGHLVVNRTIMASLTNNKALHDFYSEYGTTVVNRKGEVWKAFGDGNFNNTHHAWMQANTVDKIQYPSFTREADRVIEAVSLSLQDLWQAFNNSGKESSLLQLPANEKQHPAYLIQHIKCLSLIPIPYGTDLKTLLPDSITITPGMTRASRLLPLRNFIRSRVGNSFVVGINGATFSNEYYKGIEFRLNTGSFLTKYSYNKKEEKRGTLDYWNGYTVSFSMGTFSRVNKTLEVEEWSYQLRAGIRSNLDYWISNKKFVALYSYTEAGIQFIHQHPSFVFVPSIGWQPGALFNFNYYNMPGWLRIPAQFFLPLKTRIGTVISPARGPKYFSGIDIDYVF